MHVGPYEILAEVARGGAGVLYRARDPQGRTVALKLLQVGGERTTRRFAREIRAVSRVVHPNVARYLDAGTHGERPYLVLEFVEGRSLDERLRREGRLHVGEVRRIGLELCAALGAVHAQGLLHRDLKPANVLERADGRVLLTDFGLVRDEGGQGHTVSLTLSGAGHGTPGYWPPEQARGALDALGPPSDVYGLAATLYALLSGRPPRPDGTLMRAIEGADAPVPPLARSDVPPELERALRAALAPAPQRRPLLGQLQAALQAGPRTDRRPAPWAVGAASACALVLALVLASAALRRPGPAASSPPAEQAEAPAPPPAPRGFRTVLPEAGQPWTLEPRSASWVMPGRTLLLHAAAGCWLVDLTSPDRPFEVPGRRDAQAVIARPDAVYAAQGAELHEVPLERVGDRWEAGPARRIPLQRVHEITDLALYADWLTVAALAEEPGQCARSMIEVPYQRRVVRFGDMPVGGRPILSRALPGGGFVWMAGERGATIVELPSQRPLGRATGAPVLAVLQLEPARALLVFADGRWELGKPGEHVPDQQGRFAEGLLGAVALDAGRIFLNYGARIELYDVQAGRGGTWELPSGETALSLVPTNDALYVWTRRGVLLERALGAD